MHPQLPMSRTEICRQGINHCREDMGPFDNLVVFGRGNNTAVLVADGTKDVVRLAVLSGRVGTLRATDLQMIGLALQREPRPWQSVVMLDIDEDLLDNKTRRVIEAVVTFLDSPSSVVGVLAPESVALRLELPRVTVDQSISRLLQKIRPPNGSPEVIPAHKRLLANLLERDPPPPPE